MCASESRCVEIKGVRTAGVARVIHAIHKKVDFRDCVWRQPFQPLSGDRWLRREAKTAGSFLTVTGYQD
jgi:hypothetical protein